jgi:hypothetical protein
MLATLPELVQVMSLPEITHCASAGDIGQSKPQQTKGKAKSATSEVLADSTNASR